MKQKADNIFEEFNKNFFTSSPVKISWYDAEGVYSLDNYRRVIIRLTNSTTKDHYDGYLVKIINTQSGALITQKYFSFELHIFNWHVRDERFRYYYAWFDNNKLEWYNDKPITTSPMVKTIFEYIKQFQ